MDKDTCDELISAFDLYEDAKASLYATKKGNKTICFRCGDMIAKEDATSMEWGYHGAEVDICDYCEGDMDEKIKRT